MYQGKLQQAEMYAQYAREEAQKSGNEKQIFKAELLSVMARMSGWYNIFSVYRISRFMKGWLKSWCRTITGIIWHIFIFMHMIIGRRWLQGPTVPRHLFYISVKGWHWQKRLEMSSWYMMHIRKTLCLHQRMVWMRLPCCIPCVHTSSWNQGMMFMRAEFCPASDIIWVPWEKPACGALL